MTYQECARVVQPPVNHSKCSYRVHRTCCQCNQIEIGSVKVKIKHVNDKTTPEDGNTYWICTSTMQPLPNDSKHSYMVIGPRH